jgi:hypothetical protein
MPFGTIANAMEERKRKTAKNLEKMRFSGKGSKIALKNAALQPLTALPERRQGLCYARKFTGSQRSRG